jgi:hypothetical protein
MLGKSLLVSLVAAGTLPAPALAADPSPFPDSYFDEPGSGNAQAPWVVGHLELATGPRYPQSDVFDTDPLWLANAFGRVNFSLPGPLNFEAEIGGWAFFDDGNSDNTLQGIGHLWAEFPAAAAGIFGGTTSYFGTNIPTFGFEGAAYFGNLTLGTQGSYNWDNGNDLWGIGGGADFYLNPDLRVGGDLTYWNVAGPEIWQADLDVEKRFTGTPVSAGASLSYFEGEDFAAWTGMVHLRIFMDPPGSTLQWHDREVPFAFSLPLFGG